MSILVPVSARYPTPRPPVCLGFRYSCGSSYVRRVPRLNPIQKPKKLRIHLLPLPVLGGGIPLPGGCFSCCLRPGIRFVVIGMTLGNERSALISFAACWKSSRRLLRSTSLLARSVTGSFVGLVIPSHCCSLHLCMNPGRQKLCYSLGPDNSLTQGVYRRHYTKGCCGETI